MARNGKTLDRLLRVRTLQLGLVRADEARAQDRVASEATLRNRIAGLAESVAPAPAPGEAFSMIAAAHFRDRLHRSAEAADARLRHAERALAFAGEATREAKRDHNAIEKLIARDEADQALKAIRTLEQAPPVRKDSARSLLIQQQHPPDRITHAAAFAIDLIAIGENARRRSNSGAYRRFRPGAGRSAAVDRRAAKNC